MSAPGTPPGDDGLVVVLPCSDLAATADFYGRDLGLSVVRHGESFLTIRHGHQSLVFTAGDPPHGHAPGVRVVVAHRDPAVLHARLRALGVETDGPPRALPGGATISFLVRDPDGYAVEVRAR